MNKLSIIKDDKDNSWFKDGLHFKCTECGKCCTGASGFVWVTADEIKNMAKELNISEQNFKMKYVKNKENRLSLVEKRNSEGEYDCVFLNGKKCDIYLSRPKQCRTYPWWKENLNSKESWTLAALSCEGINDEAPIVPFEEIIRILASNENN